MFIMRASFGQRDDFRKSLPSGPAANTNANGSQALAILQKLAPSVKQPANSEICKAMKSLLDDGKDETARRQRRAS